MTTSPSSSRASIADRARVLADELCACCINAATLEERGEEALRLIDAEGPRVAHECAALTREDGRFDLLATRFQEALYGDPFHQSESFERGVSTLTAVRLEGHDPRRAFEAMVEMPWCRWWRHGRVVDWRRTEGGADFYLWPIWPRIPVRVRISIDTVLEESEEAGGLIREKVVMPARFAGCFEGPARFEILTLPDGCVLRAAWENISPRYWVRLLSYERMARNHLAAERGEMPGAPGSGYLGLRHFLDRRRGEL